MNKQFIPTFAVCFEWELVLDVVRVWSSLSVSWFMCWCSLHWMFLCFLKLLWFKYVFSSHRSRLNRTLFVRCWTQVYIISYEWQILSTLVDKFVLNQRLSNALSGLSKRFWVTGRWYKEGSTKKFYFHHFHVSMLVSGLM